MSDSTTRLSEGIAEFLHRCAVAEMAPPFYVTVTGCNGMVNVFEMTPDGDGGLHTETIAERNVGSGFAVPTNVILVDSKGSAARMVIGQGVAEFSLLN